MRTLRTLFIGSALAASVALLPQAAQAEEKPESAEAPVISAQPPLHGLRGLGSISLRGSWGSTFEPDEGPSPFYLENVPSNPYGFGIGARGGYTFSFGLYLGAFLDRQFGKEGRLVFPANQGASSFNEFDIPRAGGTVTMEASSTVFGAQVGYDLPVRLLIVRPYLETGIMASAGAYCFQGTCDKFSANRELAGIGISAIAVVSPILVGLDATYLVVAERSDLNAGTFGLFVGSSF